MIPLVLCDKCRKPMSAVRPGKWQCDCETADVWHNPTCSRPPVLVVSQAAQPKRHVPLFHFGRSVPRHLTFAGWVEKSAIHLGRGIWMFRLEWELDKQMRDERNKRKVKK